MSRELGLTHDWPVVIVGAGNLGQALANYAGFDERGFPVARLVDVDPAKVGTTIGRVHGAPPRRPARARRRRRRAIGVIATPARRGPGGRRPPRRRRGHRDPELRPVVLTVPRGVARPQGRPRRRAADPQLLPAARSRADQRRRRRSDAWPSGQRVRSESGNRCVAGPYGLVRTRTSAVGGCAGSIDRGRPGSSARRSRIGSATAAPRRGGTGMSVVVIGLNHRTAPLDLLERVTLDGDARPKALHDLRLRPNVTEVVVLSHLQPHRGLRRRRALPRRLRRTSATSSATLAGLAPEELRRPPLQPLRRRRRPRTCSRWPPGSTRPCSASPRSSARSATRGSWPSGRARRAPRSTCCSATPSRSASGPARRPAIGRGTASVSQAAVEMAAERLGLAEPGARSLVVGAGDMGEGMAVALAGRGVAEMVVANRTPERARRAAPPAPAGRVVAVPPRWPTSSPTPTSSSRPPGPSCPSSTTT